MHSVIKGPDIVAERHILIKVNRCNVEESTGVVKMVPGKGLVRSACLNIWALLEFFIEPVWTSKQERCCNYFLTSST